jgi:hypothetical protein
MKKSKLLLSSFCLALILALTVISPGKVFADDTGGPQNGSNSTKPAPPPPPPPSPDLIKLLQWLMGLIF